MIVANTDATTQARIPLGHGARRLNLTPHGLLKILQRTNSAIRDDGRWYVAVATIDQIETARRVLGIDPEARNSLSWPAYLVTTARARTNSLPVKRASSTTALKPR